MFKKVTSVFLVLVLALSLFPASAFAEETAEISEETAPEPTPVPASELIAEPTAEPPAEPTAELTVEPTAAPAEEPAEEEIPAEETPLITAEPIPEETPAPEESAAPEEPLALTPNENGVYQITSLAELKELAAGSFDTFTSAEYSGSETLIIEETLVIPANLMIHLPATKLIVPTGVTLTNNGILRCSAGLSIEGSLINNNSVTVPFGNLTGKENITSGEGTVLSIESFVDSYEEFAAVVVEAAADTSSANYYPIMIDSDIILEQNLIIPGRCGVFIRNCVLTVPADCTLVVSGQSGKSSRIGFIDLNNAVESADPGSELIIEGTLTNRGKINLMAGGTTSITLSETAEYEGWGQLNVWRGVETGLTSPFELLHGFDESQFTVQTYESGWTLQIQIVTGNMFSSFAELKSLASQSYDTMTNALYAGQGDFVFEESLTIPENLHVSLGGITSIIPQGVTLTNESNIIFDGLNVVGSLVNTGKIFVYRDKLTGVENISQSGQGYTCFACTVSDMDAFAAAISAAGADMKSGNEYCVIINKDITLDRDIGVYTNIEIQVVDGAVFTIPNGVQMTEYWTPEGDCPNIALLNGKMVISGYYQSNGMLSVHYDSGSTVTCTEGGTWSGGRGTIQVIGAGLTTPYTAAIGFESENISCEKIGDGVWNLKYHYDSGMSQYFQNFSELKTLVANPNPDQPNIIYDGAEPLTIEEDIYIPQYFSIHINNAELIIPAGVTVVNDGGLYCAKLTVEGKVENNNYMNADGQGLSGRENISCGENANLGFNYELTSFSELSSAVSCAATDREAAYTIMVSEDISLEQNICIPSKCALILKNSNLTIPEGCTLTVSAADENASNGGVLYINSGVPYPENGPGSQVIINGTLVNNGEISVVSGGNTALILSETGSYLGTGVIYVSNYSQIEQVSPFQLLPGFDETNFIVKKHPPYGWSLYPAGERPIVASGACGDKLTWKMDDIGTLTISGSGDMENYSYDNRSPWYQTGYQVTDVIIEDGVTSIGEAAFDGCQRMASVEIPVSVTSIGAKAFSSCGLLENIIIPDGVTSISGQTFEYCRELVSVVIPSSVTSIGNNAFYYCSALTSVNIPNSVTNIGDSAFCNCGALTSVTLPASLPIINNQTFADCSALVSVSIPDGVTSIGRSAFSGCSSLTDIIIPNNVTSIGRGAFGDCSSLLEITVTEGNSNYSSADGVLFNKNQTVLIRYPEGKTAAYSIPEGVTNIEDNAFNGSIGLTSVTIPASVASVGNNDMFGNCSNLAEITVADANTNYSSIEGVLFNKDQTILLRCPEGKNGAYSIPHGVTSIEDSAFLRCSALASIIIPNTVTNIGNNVFRECSSLTSAVLPEGITTIEWRLFDRCSALTTVTIPDSVTSIGDYAFSACKSLTNITIPNGVAKIGIDTFSECSALAGVTIPNGVTSIGAEAFSYCSALTNVTIPESVTSIGYYAFSECSALTSVIIPASVTSIGYGVFRGCSDLENVTIPESVTSIASQAFYGCNALSDVYYGGSETEWNKIAVESSNEPLLNANIHYGIVFDGKLLVSSVKAIPGMEVDVAVTLPENPGLAMLQFQINYDKTRLALIGYEDAGLADWTVGVGALEKAVWVSDTNASAAGEILILKFRVLDNAAEGEAEITLTDLIAANIDEESRSLEAFAGGVTVKMYFSGDSTGDGSVDTFDLLRMKKYIVGLSTEINNPAADLNGDGAINGYDLLRLQKFLAGLIAEL